MGDADKPWRDPDVLRQKYVNEGKTGAEVGDELGCSHQTVYDWMEKHDIERRSISEAESHGDVAKLHDEDWLRTEYVDKRRSTTDIADALGVSTHTVGTWLHKHKIETRNTVGNVEPLQSRESFKGMYWGEEMTLQDMAEELSVAHTTVVRWAQKHEIDTRGVGQRAGRDYDMLSPDELREMYIEQEMPIQEIADLATVSVWAVHSRLEKYGIETRSHNERTKEFNMAQYYGPNWGSQRLSALKRDVGRCRRCGMADHEHKRMCSKSLHVHHIRPRSEYVEDGEFNHSEANRLENLITLCMSCHRKIENLPVDARHLA